MAKSIEKFNPYDPKHKKLEDLPKKQRKDFKKAEDGFVKIAAEEDVGTAQEVAEVIESIRAKYMPDIKRLRAEGNERGAGVLEEQMNDAIKALEEE